ncbi:MAG: DUF4091 domain-containing protein [Candidatus Hydrogenedentes bacterium]|nr:DUF4091 domain-containing protein [Candidatus Hydrogenedentota bacterium]
MSQKHLSWIAVIFCTPLLHAQTLLVPNASFDDVADGVPAQWTLSGGEGRATTGEAFEGPAAVMLAGNENAASHWRSAALPLEPNTLYALRFAARQLGVRTGTAISGPPFCNVDLGDLTAEWRSFSHVFQTPVQINEAVNWLRFGHWRERASVEFDAVSLCRAVPIYRSVGDLVLGGGEEVLGKHYNFDAPFHETKTNHSRPVAAIRCGYNTNRLEFFPGAQIVFRHELSGRTWNSAEANIAIGNHQGGRLAVSMSADGDAWETVNAATGNGSCDATMPESMQNTQTCWVRLAFDAGDAAAPALSVFSYRFSGTFSGDPLKGQGQTTYAAVEAVSPDTDVQLLPFPEGAAPSDQLRIAVAPRGDAPGKDTVSFTVDGVPRQRQELNRAMNWSFAIDSLLPGTRALAVETESGFHATLPLRVPILNAAHYGARLPASDAALAVWTASSGWKVSRSRAVPNTAAPALSVALASNEYEAAQLVLRPAKDLMLDRVSWTDLAGPNGATLPAAAIEVLETGYVQVQRATDGTGAPGLWPDPLPALAMPMHLNAGMNQPFWVRVHAAKATAPGIYAGSISFHSAGHVWEAPIEVEVFPFELPGTMTCKSSFGFNTDAVFTYQRIGSEAEKREVTDLYLDSFARHHISPYNPAPLDPPIVNWPASAPGDTTVPPESLQAAIDFTAWDAAMTRAFDDRHFTTFMIRDEGMGGGTFHSRQEPVLHGYAADSPHYNALFSSYYQQIEAHLRTKGWLDRGHIYWFDEPDPKDYAFVNAGFARLKKTAPGIRRMLTEEAQDGLIGGPNLWCPILHNYHFDNAEKRRAEGEEFWWYVCTEPKAPYLGLFIDHPATELRVWLWQTWAQKIQGILVWTTNYWHSPTAYPKGQQDPYADPMSWVVGYGVAEGTRAPWGNGDGRFLYPPRAAAESNYTATVVEGPVESIRWEMLRDGIEDYEYFAMLQRLLAAKEAQLTDAERIAYEGLLRVPEGVAVSVTGFTSDPAPMETHRRELAAAIAALQSR